MYADPGDTTFKINCSAGSLGTPVDLGVNFPCNTSGLDMYEITFTQVGTTVSYVVKRINTVFVAAGTFTNGPTSILTVSAVALNRTSGVEASLDVSRIVIATNN
jgi:hypothetical protein